MLQSVVSQTVGYDRETEQQQKLSNKMKLM